MIASLPMYNQPDCLPALGRYWASIRDALRGAGVDAPDALSWGMPDFVDHWLRPDLVLSQTCGFPFRAVLQGKVTLIGTPDYGVDGCPPGYFRSAIVVRADDARNSLADYATARFAYNDAMSQSGWAAPQGFAAGMGFVFENVRATGAHLQSARSVLAGVADIAAIDAVTWRLLCRNDPDLAGLRVLAQTDPTPGLPYIAAPGAREGVVFAAIKAAIAALSAADRQMLGLRGIVSIPAEAYLAVPTPAPPLQPALEC